MSVLLVIIFVLVTASVNAKEIKYTGSTPAGTEVRRFLGIPLSDSVDFIRWIVTIDNDQYTLDCNYGLSKPNTPGFINDGKRIKLSGAFNNKNNIYQFRNNNNHLNIAIINMNILQLLDDHKNMLVGNGGWSYTLNNTAVIATNSINIIPLSRPFKDSMRLEGRTPCAIPGLFAKGTVCYKLKWLILMYNNNNNNNTGSYIVFSNLWSRQQKKSGTWQVIKNSSNYSFYQLTDADKKLPFFLVKMDDNIFMFADKNGSLLVGDEDFSYTLNRIANY